MEKSGCIGQSGGERWIAGCSVVGRDGDRGEGDVASVDGAVKVSRLVSISVPVSGVDGAEDPSVSAAALSVTEDLDGRGLSVLGV